MSDFVLNQAKTIEKKSVFYCEISILRKQERQYWLRSLRVSIMFKYCSICSFTGITHISEKISTMPLAVKAMYNRYTWLSYIATTKQKHLILIKIRIIDH